MGLVGLGSMGRGHLTVLEQLMADGVDIKLVALCDIREQMFKEQTATNLGNSDIDLASPKSLWR